MLANYLCLCARLYAENPEIGETHHIPYISYSLTGSECKANWDWNQTLKQRDWPHFLQLDSVMSLLRKQHTLCRTWYEQVSVCERF